MKKILFGFLLGAMVFSALPSMAAVKRFILQQYEYRVLVNDVEYTDATKPVMSYRGSVYVPADGILESLGVKTVLDEKKKQLEIFTPVTTGSSIAIPYDDTTGLPIGAVFTNSSFGGVAFQMVYFDKEAYIRADDLIKAYGIYPVNYDVRKSTVLFWKKGTDKQVILDLKEDKTRLLVRNVSYYRISLFSDLIETQ